MRFRRYSYPFDFYPDILAAAFSIFNPLFYFSLRSSPSSSLRVLFASLTHISSSGTFEDPLALPLLLKVLSYDINLLQISKPFCMGWRDGDGAFTEIPYYVLVAGGIKLGKRLKSNV